jgi:hypothetical protein
MVVTTGVCSSIAPIQRRMPYSSSAKPCSHKTTPQYHRNRECWCQLACHGERLIQHRMPYSSSANQCGQKTHTRQSPQADRQTEQFERRSTKACCHHRYAKPCSSRSRLQIPRVNNNNWRQGRQAV